MASTTQKKCIKSESAMTCPHCADKDEMIAWLKSELGIADDETQIAGIRSGLGVTRGEAHLLRAMYRAKGKAMSVAQMMEAFPASRGHEDRDYHLLNVLVCRIRKALGKGAVETVWKFGYRLTDEGVALVRGALGADGDDKRALPAPAPLAGETPARQGVGYAR